MMKRYYIKLTCEIKGHRYIEKHYDGRYGAPGMPREKKKKKTPEEMERQNCWRRARDLKRLIEANYGPGDWHVTLTCRPEERPGKEEAPKVIRKFWRDLKKEYRKQGWELKIIIVIEIGERGAVHWHMIVNDMHNGKISTAGLIRKLWDRGRTYFSPLDDSGDYGILAAYIVKNSGESKESEEKIEKQSYMRSRNLVKPKVIPEKVEARGWRKEPKEPEGWELVKGSLVNGVNQYTGQPYQYYTLRRLAGGEEEEKVEKSRRVHRDKHPGAGKRHRPGGVRDEVPPGGREGA